MEPADVYITPISSSSMDLPKFLESIIGSWTELLSYIPTISLPNEASVSGVSGINPLYQSIDEKASYSSGGTHAGHLLR